LVAKTFLSPGLQWSVEDGRLYFHILPVPKADLSTFQPLSDFWGRDAKRVYCAGREIRGADAASFSVLNRLYAKDASRTYTIKGPIKDADAATFQAIGPTMHPFNTHNGFAKDCRNVYHSVVGGVASLVRGADAASFHACGNGYGCDSRHVYFERKVLPDADPANWVHIRGLHSRSGDNAYFRDCRISEANGSRLESLPILNYGEEWSRDDQQYFCREVASDPRQYLESFSRCFVFAGKAVDASLTWKGEALDSNLATSWENAEHGWIHVVCEKWLQQPAIKVEECPRVGESFKFGEAIDLPSLSSRAWLNEDRIWIFTTAVDRSRKGKKLHLSRAPVWWQYSAMHDLGRIEGLIKEAAKSSSPA
jgi:hypothetical protein